MKPYFQRSGHYNNCCIAQACAPIVLKVLDIAQEVLDIAQEVLDIAQEVLDIAQEMPIS